ncbi:unnamed protein product [Lactuca saligna]|uniref:Uncharacterized protein n=1 Tax=Lactuca saligna TaxID=75948 RepID=A0AA35VI85_LACSI|nr:unnamed protein product [Lactuca saligna]
MIPAVGFGYVTGKWRELPKLREKTKRKDPSKQVALGLFRFPGVENFGRDRGEGRVSGKGRELVMTLDVTEVEVGCPEKVNNQDNKWCEQPIKGGPEPTKEAAVPILVKVIGNRSPRMKENAAATLNEICSINQKYLVEARELGVKEKLMDLLHHGTDRGRRKVGHLLEKMSRLAEHQKLLARA